MIVYGRNPVREAIRGPRAVERVWATEKVRRERWLRSPGPSISTCAAEEVERRCGASAHQGICAEVEAFKYLEPADVLALPEPLIMVLDEVQDPQNLGAICRTAECAGASAVVIAERRSAEVTPAVCKASSGAVEHLPVARVRNIADFLRQAKDAGAWCWGADAAASTSYQAVDYRGKAVLVLGSEGRGLRPRVAGSCDGLVAIPVRGRIESLGVSAAAAVLLYAASAQRA